MEPRKSARLPHGPDRKEIRDPYGHVAQRKQVETNAALGFGSGIQVRRPAAAGMDDIEFLRRSRHRGSDVASR